jgi:small subunit ribosomal protein S24e
MEIEIISEKENPLLKRKEVHFRVKHEQTGSTPPRLEVRNAIASALKVKADFVFVKKFKTRTGKHIAVGLANVYDSVDQARLVEPEYIIKRNVAPEKSGEAEEGKE